MHYSRMAGRLSCNSFRQNRESHESHESCSEKKKAGGEKGRRLRERREKKGSVMGFFRNLASRRNC
jgi:hypothetical protein